MERSTGAQLHGKVAIVTGASSGLGERFARVLHGEGATVAVAARRFDRLHALASALGDRVVPVRCDVALSSDREALVDRVTRELGTVDILVNNAGVGAATPAEDEALDDLRYVVEVNQIAVHHLCQLAGRVMLAQGSGSIVNIASIFGMVTSSSIRHASYCTTKAAVVGLTRALATQWAERGVRVNAIAPGWFESEMTASMWSDESALSYVQRNTPVGRRGREDELDAILLLLAGPGSTFIQGQTIVVDGGWTIT